MNMSSTAARSPSSWAMHDLGGRQAAWLACAAMALMTVVEIVLNGRLGLVFGASFVLIAITIPLSVRIRELFLPAILPPLLLIGAIALVAIFRRSAIVSNDLTERSGAMEHLIVGVIDQAPALVVGHMLALLVVALRIITAPPSERRKAARGART